MRFLWIIPQLMCVVLAAPTSRDGMCSVQCSVPDDDKATFRTGKAYTYTYVTTTVMNFPEAKDKLAPVSYEGSFTIRALTPCELSLSLNSGIRSWDKGSSVTQDDKPLRFSYQDGTIKHLCKSGEWEDWKLNTRKALLSHFETSGFLLSGPVDTYVQENDVSGSCLTRYEVKNSWGKRIITKHKDLQQCSHRDGGKTFIQGHQNAPIGDDEKGSIPLLEGNQDCTIELTNNEFKVIKCSESHAFNPSFSSDESVDKLLSTTINTKFELIDVKDDGDIRKHFPSEAGIEELPIFFTHYSYVTGEEKSKANDAKHLLEESCSRFESGQIEAIPRIYLELIDLLRAATVEDIWNLVYLAASKGACQRQQVNGHILLMNALSTVRTTASIFVMENLLTNDAGWSYVAIWVNNLAFVPNPKLEMINVVKSRISRDDVEPKQLLSVAGMAFTACMGHPVDCHKTKEIQMLNDIIQKHIPGPDQIKDRNTEDKVITAFKAVGNLGFLTEKTVESVKSYVTSDWPSLSVKLAAMDSFRRVPCGTPNVEKFYWEVMTNKVKYNPAVQIFAYVSAMRCFSEETVDKVFNILDQDCSNQVGSFVVSHMKNLLGSSPRLGGVLRSKIESYLSGNKADDFMDSDFRKFSRNYDLSLRPMKEAGVDLKSNVVFSPHSYIPAFVSSNMTVNMFGKSVNFIEVGATSQGFENVLENLFGPEGFYWDDKNSDKSYEEYFEDLFSRVKDTSLQTKEFEIDLQNSNSQKRLFQRSPKLDLFVRVFGHEVAWVPLRYDSFPNIAEKDMFHSIMSQIVELYQTFSLYNLQFIDTELSVPTVIGFPLRLNMKGAGHVDMTFFRDAKAKSKPLRPGLAMEVQGEMLMDYSLMSTGMTTVVDSFFAIEMAPLNMMESGNFIFKFDIPEQNIFKMESKAFTFHQMDGKRKEIPIELKGVASTNAAPMCFDTMGLKTCYKNRVSDQGIFSSGVMYPFETSVYVSKSDPLLTHFHLEARSSDEGTLYLLFDTPGSKVNRKVKFEASLKTDGEVDLVLSLENPIHTVELRANAVKSEDLMKLEGKFVWGDHKYGMTARADLVQQGPLIKISPSVQVVVDGNTMRLLEGKMSVSEEEVIIDLASPTAGLTAKSQALVSHGENHVKLQLQNIELSHARFKYSGDGVLEINEQDVAIIDVKLRYDHGSPHTVQIRGDFKPSISNSNLEVRSKLDFVTSQAPQYNFRVKFDVDDSFVKADKHIIFNERFDIWYGPNFEKEDGNHICLKHESTLLFQDDFNLYFTAQVLVTPYDIDARLEQVLVLGTYRSQIKSKLLLHNTEYSGDLVTQRFYNKSYTSQSELKVVYPGKTIILMITLKEEEPGFHMIETILKIDPGQQFDLHVSYNFDGKGFHANILSHDSEQLFRLTSNNTLSRSLSLFKSDLMVHNHKFMNYDVKWNEERTKGNNLEIQGHIEGVADVSLTGNVSPGNLKLMYDIKLEKQEVKLVGMTTATQTSQGSDLVSTWKYLQQSEPLVDLKITLNSAPEFTTGNVKLTVTQGSIYAELDCKLDKQLSGEHKVVAKFETPADGSELQIGANFKSKKKTMYAKLSHPKIGTLFAVEGSGEVKAWKLHQRHILTDISIHIKDYEKFLIHAYLKHLHDPGLLTTDFKLTLSNPDKETGQISCQWKSTPGITDASILVHHYDEPSLYFELKGKADSQERTYRIDPILSYGTSAQTKIFEAFLELSITLKEDIKIAKGMTVRYNDKPVMETGIFLKFDPIHLSHVNGSFDLVTPFESHEHYWLSFIRKIDSNTGETKHGFQLEYYDGIVTLETNHLINQNTALLDILLTTPNIAFDTLGLNFEHKVDSKRESFKTDFSLNLPLLDEIRLNNHLQWNAKIMSVDFKSKLFGEEFLQLEGAYDGRTMGQTNVVLKIMYEAVKIIEVSGKVLRGHDTYDGSFSIEPAKEFEVPNLKISFALTQKPAQDSTLKVVVKMDDEQLLKSMFDHTNIKDKFKVSGVIYLNEKTDLHTIKVQFSKEPKAVMGKFLLLEDEVETMNIQFSRIKRQNKDLAEMSACYETDCLQLKLQKSDSKGDSHELELQSYERNIQNPEGQTNYTFQYKYAKSAEELDHYIKLTESVAGSKEAVGYRVQYKENTGVLSLILPQRLIEVTGGVAVKPNKFSFHSSFSIDKEKKPANKLQVNFDINKTTERERGFIYAYKGSISHPKFNSKTISVEGEVTMRGFINIFGVTCDFSMLGDESSSFKIDYLLYHAENLQNIHHLNCTMNLSITSKFLQIAARGNYVQKYDIPQEIGALLAFSAEGSPQQTLQLQIIGDMKKRGHLDILLSHNEKKIDFKNVYFIQQISPGNFQFVVQSSLVSSDGKMALASDLVLKKKILESQKTVVWGGIHAYDEHAKEKYFFAVGSEDAKKIELLARKGSDHLLTHVLTSLNNSRILYSRLAWREENILQALRSAKQTASLVSEKLSDMGTCYWKELSTKTSDALKKVNFNNKLIRDFKASYIRNFKAAAKDFVGVILDKEEIQELYAELTSLVEEIGFHQLHPGVSGATAVMAATEWLSDEVMGTLASADHFLYDLQRSIRIFIQHNNFPVSYVGAVDSVLKKLWHCWISKITEVPEHYNVFEPPSPGEIVSVSKIESRVKQVLKEVTSNPNKSGHFWTDLYNRQITLLYCMMGDEFIRLVKFLREGPGKFVLYEPKWTDIQYEIYLPKSVRELHDIPTMLVQHYLPLFTDGHSTNHFMKLFETKELFPPFQSSALISGEGHIRTFDGDIVHYPTDCYFTLVEDLVHRKFSIISSYYSPVPSLTLRSGEDNIEVNCRNQAVTIGTTSLGEFKLNVTRESFGNVLKVNVVNLGVEFTCISDQSSICRVTVSGFHHGKLGGLFGTNDDEFYNEKMKPSGELLKNNREFLELMSHDYPCQYPARIDVQRQGNPRRQCEHIFDEEDIDNRSCFTYMQPKPLLKSCIKAGFPETSAKILQDECRIESSPWMMR